MQEITKIGCLCQTIGEIPTSYILSLTYEEQLLYFLQKLDKELIPSLNELIYEFSNYDKNFDDINKKLSQLETEISTFENQFAIINNTLEEYQKEITINANNIIALSNKIDNDIISLKNELINLINEDFNTLKDYVDYQDSVLNQKIDNIQIGLINVYDPTTGTIQPLQTTINNLYQLTNKDGLSASEFDALELTATNFDAYQITAYEFDSNGKTILV